MWLYLVCFVILYKNKIGMKKHCVGSAFCMHFSKCYYSLRSASTGSFFAAIRAGIKPATRVSTTLIATRIIAPSHGKFARPEICV